MCDPEEVKKLKAQLAERDALLRGYQSLLRQVMPCLAMSTNSQAASYMRQIDVALSASAEPSAPVAQCTNEDSWNCKYCRNTESCKANDLRAERKRMDEALIACANERDALRAELTETENDRKRLRGNNADLTIVTGKQQNQLAELDSELRKANAECNKLFELVRRLHSDNNDVSWQAFLDIQVMLKQGITNAKPSAPVEIDERAAFETWYIRDVGPGLANLSRINTGSRAYEDEDAMSAWEGWQARAALENKP